MSPLIPTRSFTFVGGDAGPWSIVSNRTVAGKGLAAAPRLAIGGGSTSATGRWSLHGVTSNERYVARRERAELVARQEALGRPRATAAALIPIRKSPAWWALAQDERRSIIEEQSHHIAIGLRYLPGIARRLHHCRDLGPDEPFDFLTWFEFAPEDAGAFEMLLEELRSSVEWTYVEREVEIRVQRDVDVQGTHR